MRISNKPFFLTENTLSEYVDSYVWGTFSSFGLNQVYHESYEKCGVRLSDVDKTLDWDVFRPLLESMYANKSGKGDHLNVDVILMFKIQFLEVWYNLSDFVVEREIYGLLSFWHCK